MIQESSFSTDASETAKGSGNQRSEGEAFRKDEKELNFTLGFQAFTVLLLSLISCFQ